MSYNTDFTRFKSAGLAGLDCGSYLKIPRRQDDVSILEVYDGDLEVGQCVAMVRVPAGARITGAELIFAGANDALLAVGDPFACARLLGPVRTGALGGSGTAINQGCDAYSTCTRLNKTGRVGDGCGLFYQYTCETDIVVTNLYSPGYANLGGWPGTAVPATPPGTKWLGGRLVLKISYKQAS